MNGAEEKNVNINGWNQMERKMKQFGYREGASQGHNDSFQFGFDAGYKDGYKMSEALAYTKGMASCLDALEIQTSLTEEEKAVFSDPGKGCCQLCSKMTGKASLENTIYEQGLHKTMIKQQLHNSAVSDTLTNLQTKLTSIEHS